MKSARYFSLVLTAAAALSLSAAVLLLRLPREAKDFMLSRINLIVYLNEAASAQDLNNFRDMAEKMPFFTIKEFKSSAEALEALKKDAVISESIGGIERGFTLPHSFTVEFKSLDERELNKRAEALRQIPWVDFIDIPYRELSGAHLFYSGLKAASRFSFIFLSLISLLFFIASSLFYCRFQEEKIKIALTLGFSRGEAVYSGGKRQFFWGMAWGAAFACASYFGLPRAGIDIRPLAASAIAASSAAVSAGTFIIICAFYREK